jgi:hypothetical protein
MTKDEYEDVREAFELAMRKAGVPEDAIESILLTVDDAVDNNMEEAIGG